MTSIDKKTVIRKFRELEAAILDGVGGGGGGGSTPIQDTGWRALATASGDFEPGWDATLFIRRVGDEVHVANYGSLAAVGGDVDVEYTYPTVLYNLPEGFKPAFYTSTMFSYYGLMARVTNDPQFGASIVLGNPDTSLEEGEYPYSLFSGSYLTSDAFPDEENYPGVSYEDATSG